MSDDDHEPDAAVEAFEQIRGEMALMRRAVERLAAERAEVPQIPDYSETLGRMAKALNATMQNVGVLAKAAEDNVAPRYVADRIVAAGAHARDEDRRMIASAGEKMDRATTALHGIGGVARRADEQRRTLWQVGAGACLGGALLWTVVPGVVARALPDRWQVPEWIAARTLDLPKWEAGQRLMRAAGPDAFANIAAGDRIITANRVVPEAGKQGARDDALYGAYRSRRPSRGAVTAISNQEGLRPYFFGARVNVETRMSRRRAIPAWPQSSRIG